MERVGVTLVWTFHAVVRYERATVLRIEGVTKQPRHEVIARMSEAIRANGGDILDSRFFSNTAFFVSIEIDSRRVAGLEDDLKRAGVSVSPATGAIASEGRIACHVTVMFVHNDPDLRIEVPAIPG
jgi:hypothetical protein